MEVREKRQALHEISCVGKTCSGCEYGYESMCGFSCGIYYAPDEQIELWYSRAFPEPVIKDLQEVPHKTINIRLSEDKLAEVFGEQRVFSTGAVRDSNEGKGRMDLLPWAAILEVSRHSQNGAAHYGEHSIDRGLPTSCLLDSGMRHIAKHMAGWTDEEHLVAAAWNLLWAVEMTLKHPELVDTPWMPEMEDD